MAHLGQPPIHEVMEHLLNKHGIEGGRLIRVEESEARPFVMACVRVTLGDLSSSSLDRGMSMKSPYPMEVARRSDA